MNDSNLARPVTSTVVLDSWQKNFFGITQKKKGDSFEFAPLSKYWSCETLLLLPQRGADGEIDFRMKSPSPLGPLIILIKLRLLTVTQS
jgi:hypothetical protein